MTLFDVAISRPGKADFAHKRGLSYREAHTAFCDCVALYGLEKAVRHGSEGRIAYTDGTVISIK